MATYIVRRLLQSLLIVLIVTILVFIAVNLMPGDPLYIFLTSMESEYVGQMDTIPEEQLAALRARFGLDKPIYIQYLQWMNGLLHGRFGTSVIYHEDVGKLLAERLPVTLNFSLIAFVLVSAVGWPLGILAALKRGTPWDSAIITITNLGITIPGFWLAIILIYLVGYKLRLLPIQGYVSPFENIVENLRHLILPLVTLTIGGFGGSARIMRSCMLEILQQDYLRTARSKGLKERIVIYRHALKNALIVPVTGLGMGLAGLLAGSVITETVFNIPGVGRLSVNAVFQKDYPIVMAAVLISATMVVMANLLVDILYGWLDPRVKLGQKGA